MDFRIAEEDRLLRESVRSFVEEKANAGWKQEVQQIVIAHQLRKGDVETPWA